MVVNENHYGNYITKIAHSQEKILIIIYRLLSFEIHKILSKELYNK